MRTTRARRRGAAGFSLLEVVLSLTVVMLATHAAFHAAVQSADTMRSSRETATASADLRAAMEEVLLLPIDEMPVEGSEFEHQVPVAAFADLHLDDQVLVASDPGYTPGGAVPDPLEIRLDLNLTDFGGRPRSLSRTSLKSR